MGDQVEPCLAALAMAGQRHVHKCMLHCTHAGELHRCLCNHVYRVEEVDDVD